MREYINNILKKVSDNITDNNLKKISIDDKERLNKNRCKYIFETIKKYNEENNICILSIIEWHKFNCNKYLDYLDL